jgi:hypothetical protein
LNKRRGQNMTPDHMKLTKLLTALNRVAMINM